mmetsp:Transcript_17492/g.45508  ORF Transcript_17492/g.45508 Transcript_17492/m.45508 type:complete len:370 (-) Transcript_17492:215-1324(-)
MEQLGVVLGTFTCACPVVSYVGKKGSAQQTGGVRGYFCSSSGDTLDVSMVVRGVVASRTGSRMLLVRSQALGQIGEMPPLWLPASEISSFLRFLKTRSRPLGSASMDALLSRTQVMPELASPVAATTLRASYSQPFLPVADETGRGMTLGAAPGLFFLEQWATSDQASLQLDQWAEALAWLQAYFVYDHRGRVLRLSIPKELRGGLLYFVLTPINLLREHEPGGTASRSTLASGSGLNALRGLKMTLTSDEVGQQEEGPAVETPKAYREAEVYDEVPKDAKYEAAEVSATKTERVAIAKDIREAERLMAAVKVELKAAYEARQEVRARCCRTPFPPLSHSRAHHCILRSEKPHRRSERQSLRRGGKPSG